MHLAHLDVLVCPQCRARYDLERSEGQGDYVVRGRLKCAPCGSAVAITGGIPRFSGESYARSFSKQWKLFPMFERMHPTDTRDYYASGLGLVPEDVTGKRILEIGCGAGRAVGHFLQGDPELYVAFDLSEAVDVVEQRFRSKANLLVLQSDMASLPLSQDYFDVVFSYGVIHHTPDPPKYFSIITRHVRPGGSLSVHIYQKGTRFGALSNYVQDRSSSIPEPVLALFCGQVAALSCSLWAVSKVPMLNRLYPGLLRGSRSLFRVMPTPNPRMAYLWAHDYHMTRYTFEYSADEVRAWFERGGFQQIEHLKGSCFKGVKTQ